MLQGKKILLGISGSIAAYKSASLARLLVTAGADVQVVMTTSACDFITPLTMATLTGKPVMIQTHNASTGEWHNHVHLGLWADAMLIAPASANTLAKCANGICDNLLIACYLSARCPVFFAPAMDLDMYSHGSTAKNLSVLESYGNTILPAESGILASGLVGQGRMQEPEHIVNSLSDFFSSSKKKVLEGKKILITAGPTQEPIDPVRYIGNRSSGKMGYAIAEACMVAGADVCLVSGPTNLAAPTGLEFIQVQTAKEMFHTCTKIFPKFDIGIMSAAVADYTPEETSLQKIKKLDKSGITLNLAPTPDTLAKLGEIKKSGQILIGFALETENGEENAKKKLARKNADAIVLNLLTDTNQVFGSEHNNVQFVQNGKKNIKWEGTKHEIAKKIVAEIANLSNKTTSKKEKAQ